MVRICNHWCSVFAISPLLTLSVIDGTCILKSETTLTLKYVLGFLQVRTKYVPGTGHVSFHAARLFLFVPFNVVSESQVFLSSL
jgi:hypothetical protein